MKYSSAGFSIDDIGFVQTAGLAVLGAAARGELDLNQLAREELASRGRNEWGEWVGFRQAAADLAAGSKPEVREILASIAKRQLGIEVLEERRSDSLDFHNVGVVSINAALHAAFEAGCRIDNPAATPLLHHR